MSSAASNRYAAAGEPEDESTRSQYAILQSDEFFRNLLRAVSGRRASQDHFPSSGLDVVVLERWISVSISSRNAA